ncbi:MAG: low molecular weight protein arginine phosphatase [Syntrophomonas sp.]|nr:low molecular weight protein arginine phosphatase [Syntrophomonas sp.]
MITILFVCTGNTCRSPMASALLLKKWQEKSENLKPGEIQVWSAGLVTHDDLPASPQAIEAMREEGIDISLHRSSHLRESHIREADLILTMTTSQRDNMLDRFPDIDAYLYTLGEFTGDEAGEVLDPYGQDMDTYRRSLSQLKLLVDRLIIKIIEWR